MAVTESSPSNKSNSSNPKSEERVVEEEVEAVEVTDASESKEVILATTTTTTTANDDNSSSNGDKKKKKKKKGKKGSKEADEDKNVALLYAEKSLDWVRWGLDKLWPYLYYTALPLLVTYAVYSFNPRPSFFKAVIPFYVGDDQPM